MLGTGAALPGPPVSTAELLDRVDRHFGVGVSRAGRALARRLGVDARHLARDLASRRERPRPGHGNPDLAAAAVRAALAEARLDVADLAYLIGHTTTPACLVPPNVALVADLLGYDGPYMELRQACTGFANALVVAQGLVSAPGAGPVAIVGSETGSVYFDPARAADDPAQLVNLVQMGDGAAAIIAAPDHPGPGARVTGCFFGQAGLGMKPGLAFAAGGSDAPFVDGGVLEFAHDYAAVRAEGARLFERGAAVARSLGADLDAVEHVIPHQANGRMAALLGSHFGIEPRRFFVNADRVGNTGSASIWLALAELRSTLAPGGRVLALGAEATKFMFGGFTYVHG